ncbi:MULTISPECIES: oxygen-dependent coproporphyrinogen oxidase [unclassified Mucilaginibacter]|uniref:oxygen-dependent coproporphyrinogen oxidase n=1 Tax=unclassified Mucilaginibacter TaxID=2617802 RepID=UPI002AC97DDB|nr:MULTISPECIES: oxygen-dependent coproporphyrinogen oxidase [unclassified Mucilaginibacter]MEB0260737.1 oxygen-dependent coproporphyrinogen oxidase [Mucilaginibacter sp. 10I4]MEB0278951.1 oxygen-dependent coproporphyrinogen oxidase [Mucilaginibacter sp. 10B2]MEB0302864.1 oxygen-dependent coproporphyrinogen oxidase [Mucilaginibacter sp. 5C4]WPX22132.1 oxygen-dependent coproporphyrinogen oxidase [Mucilaginibacter sp. 5C4]
MITKEQIAANYKEIQDEICAALEATDGKSTFEEELWEREGGGGGRTRIIQNGSIFEKGGVNFSAVYGQLPHTVKKALNVEQDDFFATGISIVIHPNHPWVPIIHMNIRYFEMPSSFNNDTPPVRWFGGGIDLTPHYVVEDDARFFHQQLKTVCDQFNTDFYERFKTWADNYFYIKHRDETRGIGGIFYDRLTATDDITWETVFEFSKALGRSFIPTYTELVNRSRDKQFTDEQQQWQYQRRSRYTEFNLVYDAGTKFGLETNGRIESILMSLPPTAKWVYNYQAQPGSEEEKTLSLLKKGINWV